MTVYVDDVRHSFRNMIMCHMWADSDQELWLFAKDLGLKYEWIQVPPKASWTHFDISLTVKVKALAAGAVLTDKYGPSRHTAVLRNDVHKIELIDELRIAKVLEAFF